MFSWEIKVSIFLSVIKDFTQIIVKNGSIFTFGVQMWFALQILSLTPSKK